MQDGVFWNFGAPVQELSQAPSSLRPYLWGVQGADTCPCCFPFLLPLLPAEV